MFRRFAVLIAVVAVSASLAVNAPDTREPSVASSNTVAHKRSYQQQFEQKGPQQNGAAKAPSGGGKGLSSLLGVLSLPKKLVGAVTSVIGGLLKSLGEQNLLKAAKLAALVTVLGTVATVGAVAVAGLVSAVSAICGVVLYVKYLLGAGNNNGGGASDSHIDNVSDFVNGAFSKYEQYEG
ncbi:Hypothetical protein CINCED_3A020189 [Cinara cedri]|uniref:Uncharacterized protein n=1 Tax=Cinara cedri TaxID=506608 RepID=A0A5E4MKP8_9HEMI|nr:Hypothetical protein CINCED_3A020189 [Cinara cedri]